MPAWARSPRCRPASAAPATCNSSRPTSTAWTVLEPQERAPTRRERIWTCARSSKEQFVLQSCYIASRDKAGAGKKGDVTHFRGAKMCYVPFFFRRRLSLFQVLDLFAHLLDQ